MSEQTVAGGGEMYVLDSPYEVARWRPLVNWVLFIPHAIIQNSLRSLAFVMFVVNWVGLVFTGRLTVGLYDFIALAERYDQRTTSFLFGFTERYAPFEYKPGAADDGAYPPVRVNLPEAPKSTSRWAALNFVLAIPHYIVLLFIAIAALLVLLIGWFAVLFTGAWPRGMRDFLVRFNNYWLRVWAYVNMVHTTYPRFGL